MLHLIRTLVSLSTQWMCIHKYTHVGLNIHTGYLCSYVISVCDMWLCACLYTNAQLLCSEFKICLLVYKSLRGAAPGYLREYCRETYSSALGLRLWSTDKCDLLVRRMKTRFGDRAFSAAGPRRWNRLPAALRTAVSIDSFKTGLKTYLFSIAYPGC